MSVVDLSITDSLAHACERMLVELCAVHHRPQSNMMWRIGIASDMSPGNLLRVVRGGQRFLFKSRDHDYVAVGFGSADLVTHLDHHLIAKVRQLLPDQIYFGGMRFDEEAVIASEWASFGKQLFMLPAVMIFRRNDAYHLAINFCVDNEIFWPAWHDQVITVLHSLCQAQESPMPELQAHVGDYQPSQQDYARNVDHALGALVADAHCKKVVIGRRHTLKLESNSDPSHLLLHLEQKSHHAFLFFLDAGLGEVFLGASCELLYRRRQNMIETESLAGTRARASNFVADHQLQKDLRESFKDNHEHELVSLHIEEKLHELGATKLTASNLEVMALTYVQHLLKRYRATIAPHIDDEMIIRTLHPTPAVCGLTSEWARDFIRCYEGFDRGFYAGPIGYLANDRAEFSVAIRSALWLAQAQQLYLYAACGIVPGSTHWQEWEELNNKEKNILSIFSTT